VSVSLLNLDVVVEQDHCSPSVRYAGRDRYGECRKEMMSKRRKDMDGCDITRLSVYVAGLNDETRKSKSKSSRVANGGRVAIAA